MCASVNDSTLTPDSRQERIAFLNYLFGLIDHPTFIEITYIAPPGVEVDGPRIVTHSYRLREQRPDWYEVERMNERGYGVYYGVTPKRRRLGRGQRSDERNTALCNALWVDVDLDDGVYATLEDACDGIARAIHVPAGALVASGGGVHALWVIEPVPVTPDTLPIIKATLRGLAKAVHGDTSVAELARVLRLPGTVNTKPNRNGARCEVIDILPHVTRLEDYAMYRDVEAKPPALDRTFAQHKPADLPQYVAWYLDNPHAPGNRNNILNWTAYKMHSDGYEQAEAESLLLPRALADGLGEDEARRTIASAFRAKPGAPSRLSDAMKRRMRAGDVFRRLRGA